MQSKHTCWGSHVGPLPNTQGLNSVLSFCNSWCFDRTIRPTPRETQWTLGQTASSSSVCSLLFVILLQGGTRSQNCAGRKGNQFLLPYTALAHLGRKGCQHYWVKTTEGWEKHLNFRNFYAEEMSLSASLLWGGKQEAGKQLFNCNRQYQEHH